MDTCLHGIIYFHIRWTTHTGLFDFYHTADTISKWLWTDVGTREWFIDVNTLNQGSNQAIIRALYQQ